MLTVAQTATAQVIEISCAAPLEATATGCRALLNAGDVKMPVTLRVTRGGIPVADAIVVSSAECCVTDARMKTDSEGFASTFFAGRVKRGAPQIVEFRVYSGSHQATKQIAFAARGADVTSIRLANSGQTGFRDDFLVKPIRAFVEGPENQEDCERLSVSFTPMHGQAATVARPRWVQQSEYEEYAVSLYALANNVGTCTAEVEWKLANTLGEQRAIVSVVDAESRGLPVDTVGRAYSRHPPRFVAGFALATGDDGAKTVFGADVPIFFKYCGAVCRHVRPVVGTSFQAAKEDYFGGLLFLPMLVPEREGLPVQLLLGAMNPRRFFGALTLDASGLLGTAIAAIK